MIDIVVGLQWGDEGKGRIVDFLSSNEKTDYVARYSGGPNAAHTVTLDKKEVVLSQVPAGVFNKNTKLVITDNVFLNPSTLVKEIEMLENKIGFDRKRIIISEKAKVILKLHRDIDASRIRFKEKIDSTGNGIAQAMADFYLRQGVFIKEYLHEEVLNKVARERLVNNFTKTSFISQLPGQLIHNMNYKTQIKKLKPLLQNIDNLFQDANDKRILFEGSQGFMLDIYCGSYPYTTSSSNLSYAAFLSSNISLKNLRCVWGILKSYSTRIHTGNFRTEIIERDVLELLQKSGNEYIHHSEIPLRCGWLDLPFLKKACERNGVNKLVITKVDVIGQLNFFKVCIKSLEGTNLEFIKFEGWKIGSKKIEHRDDLPKNCLKFLDYIENYLQIGIAIISYGPERHDCIVI